MPRGGYRPGSGRKKGPPKKTVGIRILESKAGEFKRQAYALRSRIEGTPGASPAPGAAPAAPRPCDSKKPACSYTVPGGLCSVEAPLLVPGVGYRLESIPARWCLIEAGELLTSHNPITGFGPRRGYPAQAQERDYRRADEQQKVRTIAENLQPELIFNTAPGALDGPPVVTRKGIVLGGNGRTMALQLVYNGEGVSPELPRGFLIEHAYEFGLDAAEVEKFKNPVVVRTIEPENEEPRTLAKWSRILNTSLSQQLDPVRLAVSQARYLDPSALEELRDLDDDETLAVFLASNRSRAFVASLQRSGVIDQRSAAVFLASSGLLNDKGRKLVQDLLLAVLLEDADVIDQLPKSAAETLARAAPYLVQTQSMGAWDVVYPLRLAVRDWLTLRAQGLSLSEFRRQAGLFGVQPLSLVSPEASELLSIFDKLHGSPAKFTKFARRFLSLAKAPASGQGGLFGVEELTPLEALQQAAREAGV